MIHNPRELGRGGGVGFIFRSCLNLSTYSTQSFPSFEALCTKVSLQSSSLLILTLYRPPSSSIADFLSDFSSLLEDLATSPSELVITGDLNIHCDDLTNSYSASFLSLLNNFDLKQHVDFPTHWLGHTLDLFISRASSAILANFSSTSDHSPIFCNILLSWFNRPFRTTKIIRSINSINIPSFCADILSSDVYSCSSLLKSNLDSFVKLFNSTLSTLVDKHAPSRSISCSSNASKPFFTKEI
jgi:hypothetical protein